MKRLACQFILALAVVCASDQASAQPLPEWKVTATVSDESGLAVPGAEVEIWYRVPPPPDRTELSEKISGLTDSNGVFTATHKYTAHSLALRAVKSGYYPTVQGYELGPSYDPARWNPNITLLLKRIIRPIPMWAKAIREGPPVFDKPVGYDLVAGDWLAPYGKGGGRRYRVLSRACPEVSA